MSKIEEIWKDIPNYEGLYQASTLGRIRSLTRTHLEKPIIRVASTDKDGYLKLVLVKNKQRKTFRVHRLVAETFIPNPENKPQVNHRDENPANNCVTNLEWMTPKENINYGTGIERRATPSRKRVRCIETGVIYSSITDAEIKTGISHAHLSLVCNKVNGNKTAHGYHWEFI